MSLPGITNSSSNAIHRLPTGLKSALWKKNMNLLAKAKALTQSRLKTSHQNLTVTKSWVSFLGLICMYIVHHNIILGFGAHSNFSLPRSKRLLIIHQLWELEILKLGTGNWNLGPKIIFCRWPGCFNKFELGSWSLQGFECRHKLWVGKRWNYRWFALLLLAYFLLSSFCLWRELTPFNCTPGWHVMGWVLEVMWWRWVNVMGWALEVVRDFVIDCWGKVSVSECEEGWG